MNKVPGLGIAFLVLVLVLSCTSTVTTNTVPHVYTNNESTKFEVLGEILYETRERVGYVELLRATRNLYPDCDYVIDIMIDQRITTTTTTPHFLAYVLMPFFVRRFESVDTNITWVMRGTAIRYTR